MRRLNVLSVVTFVPNTQGSLVPPREIRDYKNINWFIFRQCLLSITEQIENTIGRVIPTITLNQRGLRGTHTRITALKG